MTLRTTTVRLWWVECPVPGCGARCPEHHDDIEAWPDRAEAHDFAIGEAWVPDVFGELYCPDHGARLCVSCGRWLTEQPMRVCVFCTAAGRTPNELPQPIGVVLASLHTALIGHAADFRAVVAGMGAALQRQATQSDYVLTPSPAPDDCGCDSCTRPDIDPVGRGTVLGEQEPIRVDIGYTLEPSPRLGTFPMLALSALVGGSTLWAVLWWTLGWRFPW